ncbi:glutaredoxin family protein [Marinicellulosiphila megalodicopiae]|uniref:glutaredoxin family protein n=1 Tax=Marinicellulosiphila megalodicopiae TaxID=2724896 RepID=UPI003BB0E76B
MKIIRVVLGALILFLDWVFTPKSVKRSAAFQKQIEQKVKGLTLYQYKSCPFCVKVRRELKRQSIRIPLKDPKRDEVAKTELLDGAGRLKVPCLKIVEGSNVRWMFESSDIIEYIRMRTL